MPAGEVAEVAAEGAGPMTLPPDAVEVATGGTIERRDRCWVCRLPLLYRVDEHGAVKATFCGNPDCDRFVMEIPEW